MDNLICTECKTTYYSAAAEAMIERGERCDCGALLRFVAVSEVTVGGPAQPPPVTSKTYGGRRRFTRG